MPSLWFKIPALCTALGLGGIYVWKQQQKAAPPDVKATERTVLPSSKSRPVIEPITPTAYDEEAADLPDEEESPLPEAQEQQTRDRVLMPGSKSAPVRPEAEPPAQRRLLPGSKSLGPILDSPKTNGR